MWRVSAVLLASLAMPLAAQQPRVDATIDVAIVNIDAVVTDREGNRVRGLTAADFEVYENGKPQPITNFSEFDLPALPAEARPSRKIVIFVDNFTLDFFNRRRVFQALREFLRQNVAPGDEVMVVNWNRRLRIEVPPTDDVARVEERLALLEREVSLGRLQTVRNQAFLREPRGNPPVGGGGGNGMLPSPEFRSFDHFSDQRSRLTRARVQAQLIHNDVVQTANAVNSVLTRMAGVSGRKVLVLISEGLQMQPGREVLSATGDEFAALESADLNIQALIYALARTANASGVTIYSMHAAGTGSGLSVEDESVADAISRYAAGEANSIQSLSHLAVQTGGRLTARTGNFTRAFQQVAEDLQGWYSIGYRATPGRNDTERQLTIRMKNANYMARTRRTFVDKSRKTDIREQVAASLFFAPAHSQIAIAACVEEPRPARRWEVRVPVQVTIPPPG